MYLFTVCLLLECKLHEDMTLVLDSASNAHNAWHIVDAQ